MKFASILTVTAVAAPTVLAFAPSSRFAAVPRTAVRVSSSDDDQRPSFDVSFLTDAADRAMKELPNFDASKVQENLQKGELGQRGEVYFVAQAVLMLAIVLGGIPVLGDPIRVVLSPVLLLAGAGIGVLSLVDLGSDSLTPFPKPAEGSSLKTTGVYSQMRHPMYSALLCFSLGLAMVTDSVDRLLLTGLLWYLLEVKTEKEETYLVELFGAEYERYQVSSQ